MNKKIQAVFAAAGVSLAASQANAQDLSINATFGFETEYVFRGVQYASESFQPAIEFGYGAFYGGVWSNQAINDGSPNEVDYFGGYTMALNDAINLDVGATVYQYPDSLGDGQTEEIFVGATYATLGSPSLYAYYDFDLETVTLEASGSHALTVNESTAFEIGAQLGYVDEQGGTEYYYYGVTADMVFSLPGNSTLSFGARAAANDDNRGPGGRENNLWGGFSFASGF